MKIKILTFYFADNYGAVLQTYALQGALNKIGCEALVSNYIPSTMQYESKISSLKDLLYFHTKKKIHDRFELFRRKYLNISMDSLSENDVYVAGSDQIWNLDITKNDYTYYLDFNNNDKSFYYAASIGKSDYNDSQFEKVKKYLLRNNNISVREKSFCSSLNKRINDKKINYVLDPTLLHDSNFWRNIELKPKL